MVVPRGGAVSYEPGDPVPWHDLADLEKDGTRDTRSAAISDLCVTSVEHTLTSETLPPPVDLSTRPMALMLSKWLQRVPRHVENYSLA